MMLWNRDHKNSSLNSVLSKLSSARTGIISKYKYIKSVTYQT